MKLLSLGALIVAATAYGSPALVKRANPSGIDVSHFQGAVNFKTAKANGVVFTYIKATEGTSMCSPSHLPLSSIPTCYPATPFLPYSFDPRYQ